MRKCGGNPAEIQNFRAAEIGLCTQCEPQYLRATAYLPPAFVANHTTSHAAIARIAQIFIESVGVPTVQDWFNNARHLGWSLTQPGPGAAPNTWSPELIPPNHPGTSHYRFFGRPVGALDTLLGSPHTPAPAPAPASVPVPVVVIGDDEDDFEDMTMGLMDAIERANSAEAESADRLERIHQLEQQVDILIARVAAANTLADDLEGQLLTARRALSARDATLPTTPSRSRPRPPVVRTPASSSRGPPPYTPTAPHHRTPFLPPSLNPRSPVAAPEPDNENQPSRQLDDLDVFIDTYNLQTLAVGIRVVIRAVTPAKWHGELAAMGVNTEFVSPLIDIVVRLAPSP
ncbi:hypothetical protein B0H14DRAFT_3543888 [Mycena olivaceomarginata]|nr:hypothetical protein B0H14DRAFT_3543888 [Mycena olivaceomarginata]